MFAQHLAIAETLLEDIVPLSKRFLSAIVVSRQRTVYDLRHEVGSRWEDMWRQLDEARAAATRLGREVSAYDQARTTAGNLWAGAADFHYEEWTRENRRELVRVLRAQAPAEQPARAAIESLRLAVPEVIVPRAPASKLSATPLAYHVKMGLIWLVLVAIIVNAVVVSVRAYHQHGG